jgi:cytochrome c peroxidase
MKLKPFIFFFIFAISLILLTSASIDLNNLFNYSGQTRPSYIIKDNTTVGNPITNSAATLGRVLFYDKSMSLNSTIACASCHKQQFAFSDTAVRSLGLSRGLTGRHSMRLINSRFATEAKFFWDERAITLEDQSTRPIKDHVEMGFSNTNGDPDFDSLVHRLQNINYYKTLFKFVYGDTTVSETRIQFALAQFIRSIQSFDSKFDAGRVNSPNDAAPFNNFTQNENAGKALFLAPPPQGAGCQGCHRAPEFDIDPNSRNNGVTAVAGNPTVKDFTNTRAPSLRDIFNPNGSLNGPLMHNGVFSNIQQVINHYNLVPQDTGNNNLDNRLAGPGGNLQLTAQEQSNLISFLRTLTGSDVYTNPKWSNPFENDDSLNLTPLVNSIKEDFLDEISVFPNPTKELININLMDKSFEVYIYNQKGSEIKHLNANQTFELDVSNFTVGVYTLVFISKENGRKATKFFVKD